MAKRITVEQKHAVRRASVIRKRDERNFQKDFFQKYGTATTINFIVTSYKPTYFPNNLIIIKNEKDGN